MKITRSGAPTAASSVRRSSGAAKSGAFAEHLAGPSSAAESPGVGGMRPAANLDALLSVQEMGDALDSRTRAHQRADEILDGLDELRHDLLRGALKKAQIERLARLVRLKREQGVDPRLAEILDQIELRAEVELAKYSTLD